MEKINYKPSIRYIQGSWVLKYRLYDTGEVRPYKAPDFQGALDMLALLYRHGFIAHARF